MRRRVGFCIAMVASSVLTGHVVADDSPVGVGESTASKLVLSGPCRRLDTRSATGGAAKLASGGVVALEMAGRCGVPERATSVVVTLTVTDTEAPGYLSVWPSGTAQPPVSTLNWSRSHETRANSAIVSIGDDGYVTLLAASPAHLVVDVSGYFVPAMSSSDGRLVPLALRRLLDTRTVGRSALTPGGVERVSLPTGVPDDAIALSVNLTITASQSLGFVSAYAAGSARPPTSVLNTDGAGQTRAVGVIVPVSAEGFDVFSSAGGHLVVDLNGYFTGPSAPVSADGLLVVATPTRVLDTRHTDQSQLYRDGSQLLDTTLVTDRAAAIVVNLAMTQPSAGGFVTAFPAGSTLPPVSVLNVDTAGESVANMAIVPSGELGLVVYAGTSTHLVADVTGWFTGSPAPASSIPHVLSNVKPPGPDCSFDPVGRAAVADRVAQRVWLCEDGVAVSDEMPFTAGPINDAPTGDYQVYFKRDPWYGGGYRLADFTAFTRGDHGGRVGFHRYVAMSESDVGTEEYRNASHGCFRLRKADADLVYHFLRYGDTVRNSQRRLSPGTTPNSALGPPGKRHDDRIVTADGECADDDRSRRRRPTVPTAARWRSVGPTTFTSRATISNRHHGTEHVGRHAGESDRRVRSGRRSGSTRARSPDARSPPHRCQQRDARRHRNEDPVAPKCRAAVRSNGASATAIIPEIANAADSWSCQPSRMNQFAASSHPPTMAAATAADRRPRRAPVTSTTTTIGTISRNVHG